MLRVQRVAGAMAMTLMLAACFPNGGLHTPEGQAPGVKQGKAEDPLTVGHRLLESGEHELALKSYYRAAAAEGVNADVLAAIGSANLKLGRLGQAEQMLRRALELDPNFVSALNNLGVVLLEKGEYGEASRVFERAAKLDKDKTPSIKKNLKLAQSRMPKPSYESADTSDVALVRRGQGEYLLTTK